MKRVLLFLPLLFLLAPSAQADSPSTEKRYVVLSQGNAPLPELDRTFRGELRGGILRASPREARSLRSRDLLVELDRPVELLDSSWGRDRLDQRTLPLDGIYSPAFASRGGQGVRAYVFDTGAYSEHLDYAGKLLPGKDYWRDYNGTEDCDGHGTHVTSTIVGDKYGLAPRAKVVPVRVVNCLRWASTSLLIEGLGWMLEVNPKNTPALVNMSLRMDRSPLLEEALFQVMDAGILPVAAAGNSNEDACSIYPAGIEEILTVGATNIRDEKAGFSNWGSCIDVWAPGEGILGAEITGPDDTRVRSGTSMAAPHAVGAAAVLLGQYPALQPQELIELMVRNSSKGLLSGLSSDSPNRLLWMGPGADFYDPGVRHDAFATPRALEPEKCLRDSNRLASREDGEPAHGGRGYSLWYSFRSQARKQYLLRTFQSAIGTRIAVYRGKSVSSLSLVAKAAPRQGRSSHETTLSLRAGAGVLYRVVVDSRNRGDFVLCGRSTGKSKRGSAWR